MKHSWDSDKVEGALKFYLNFYLSKIWDSISVREMVLKIKKFDNQTCHNQDSMLLTENKQCCCHQSLKMNQSHDMPLKMNHTLVWLFVWWIESLCLILFQSGAGNLNFHHTTWGACKWHPSPNLKLDTVLSVGRFLPYVRFEHLT